MTKVRKQFILAVCFCLVHQGEMVCFLDFVLDDVIGVVVRISELFVFGSHEMR